MPAGNESDGLIGVPLRDSGPGPRKLRGRLVVGSVVLRGLEMLVRRQVTAMPVGIDAEEDVSNGIVLLLCEQALRQVFSLGVVPRC